MTTNEFLSAELARTQGELRAPILNRGRWDALCEDRRLLVFLTLRAGTADFQGVAAELRQIADGRMRPPGLTEPRRKAEDCLRDWTKQLASIA